MIIVTNRNLDPKAPPEERFGPNFNQEGPQNLRLAEAWKVKGKWKVEVCGDTVTRSGKSMLASEKIFLELQERMRRLKRNCLFFVHGFNNSFCEALERGLFFEATYGVEVVVFTWPANGGGVKGVVSYKSDKREAQLSVNALDRAFEKLAGYLVKHRETACDQSFNLLLHSMGNFLFQNLLTSAAYTGETLLFDNIVMAAADVNNPGHTEWADRIAFRRRLYVTLNENDGALLASRLKFGEQQLARLGHFTRNLTSRHATYVDFTGAAGVGKSHAYFEDAAGNKNVKRFFRVAINGGRAEEGLLFNPEMGAFAVS